MVDFCQLIKDRGLCFLLFDNCFNDYISQAVVGISDELNPVEDIFLLLNSQLLFVNTVLQTIHNGCSGLFQNLRMNII